MAASSAEYCAPSLPSESALPPARTGFCSIKAGSKRSCNTRPSMSSGTGWPMRCRIVGAISISRAPWIWTPFLKGLPCPIKIPSRRCVPPHSALVAGFRSRISTAGSSLWSGKLGFVEKLLVSHQSRIRSAASWLNGPLKISSRRKIRAWVFELFQLVADQLQQRLILTFLNNPSGLHAFAVYPYTGRRRQHFSTVSFGLPPIDFSK